MSGYGFALFLVAVVLLTIVQLLRTRRVREKYATAWILVGIVVAVLAVFPRLLTWTADLVGIATPVNLLFALGGVALLVACIQFSVEISVLESETRTLAEEIALIRHELQASTVPPEPGPHDPAGPAVRPSTDSATGVERGD